MLNYRLYLEFLQFRPDWAAKSGTYDAGARAANLAIAPGRPPRYTETI